MFLFNRTIQWIHMAEDKMQFMIVATFVWSKHNRVGCFVVELHLKCKITKNLKSNAQNGLDPIVNIYRF